MCEQTIPDGEVLLRRIPPPRWGEPEYRLTSAHFRLRKDRNEEGLSVYRQRIVDAEAVLNRPDAIPGSFVAVATAGDIRALKGGDGKPLQLDVVAIDDENDPGHAEIRGPVLGKMSDSASTALRKLFKRV